MEKLSGITPNTTAPVQKKACKPCKGDDCCANQNLQLKQQPNEDIVTFSGPLTGSR